MLPPHDLDRSPIFVVGTGRSGTTLLRNMLCAHPRIHLTHEASFYVWEGLFAHRKGGEAYLEHFFSTFSYRWLHLDPARIVGEVPAPLTRSHYRDLYLAIMKAKAHDHGKVRFGDKTPSHSGNLGAIFRDFPDARVVRIVRDPRAVVHSLGRMPWGTSNLLAASFFCELERMQVSRYTARILEIRLEDLLASPRPVMERVLAFVGEPWDDAVLDHTAHAPDDLPPVPWFQSAGRRPSAPSGPPRWQTDYTPTEIRLLEVLNRSGLQQGDYAPAPLDHEPGRLAVFARWLRGLPDLLRFLVAFLRHAWAARRQGPEPEAHTRALFKGLNPPAWDRLEGFEMPPPPPLHAGWQAARTTALARRDTPHRWPVQPFDRAFAAARAAGAGCVSLQFTYPRAPRIDPERLRRATRLLLHTQPWLACRLVHDGRTPQWERVHLEDDQAFVVVEDEAAWVALQRTAIDQHTGPLARVGLWRSDAVDHVMITVSHAISDGRGAVHAMQILGAHYRGLADPGYRAEPDLGASRSTRQLWRALPWSAAPHVLRNIGRRLAMDRVAFPAHKLRIPDDPRTTETNYVVRALDSRRLGAFAKERGATIHDVLSACFLRALMTVQPWDGTRALTMVSTVDLRRYLPGGEAEAVCNLSIGLPLTVGTDPGPDLDATLTRVVAGRGDLAAWSGVGLELATVPLVGLLPYPVMAEFVAGNKHKLATADRPPDLFSNMGRFPLDSVVLEAAPDRALGLPQFLDPPRYQLAAMGSGDSVFLLSAVWPSKAREERVMALVDAMVAELPEGMEPEPGRNLFARG